MSECVESRSDLVHHTWCILLPLALPLLRSRDEERGSWCHSFQLLAPTASADDCIGAALGCTSHIQFLAQRWVWKPDSTRRGLPLANSAQDNASDTIPDVQLDVHCLLPEYTTVVDSLSSLRGDDVKGSSYPSIGYGACSAVLVLPRYGNYCR